MPWCRPTAFRSAPRCRRVRRLPFACKTARLRRSLQSVTDCKTATPPPPLVNGMGWREVTTCATMRAGLGLRSATGNTSSQKSVVIGEGHSVVQGPGHSTRKQVNGGRMLSAARSYPGMGRCCVERRVELPFCGGTRNLRKCDRTVVGGQRRDSRATLSGGMPYRIAFPSWRPLTSRST